jgi:NAD-dependent deacetylase
MSESEPEIVILTGAGISAESGIATFRGADGLWEGHRFEEVASPEGFRRDPGLVHRFYNLRRAGLDRVEPNAAHRALVRLEREWRGRFLLVTQNVDDLHERAGSERLVHMHGELRKALCEGCGKSWEWVGDLGTGDACIYCGRVGEVRPDIVWFGEMPYGMDGILAALGRCAIFVSVGTSGSVYPAAGFVDMARRVGARTVECNVAETSASGNFGERRTGLATEVVPALVEELLGS